MTKIDGRTKEIAANQINDSLKRLKVDHIDLLQHHEVIRYDDPIESLVREDLWKRLLLPNRQGRYASLVSPGTRIRTFTSTCWKLRRSTASTLTLYRCRSISWTLIFAASPNWSCRKAVKQRVGVLGMKCFGGGVIMKSNVVEPMDLPSLFVECSHIRAHHRHQHNGPVEPGLCCRESFQPMDETQVASLVSKTQDAALNGKYELLRRPLISIRLLAILTGSVPIVRRCKQLAPQLPG